MKFRCNLKISSRLTRAGVVGPVLFLAEAYPVILEGPEGATKGEKGSESGGASYKSEDFF